MKPSAETRDKTLMRWDAAKISDVKLLPLRSAKEMNPADHTKCHITVRLFSIGIYSLA